MGLLNIQPPSHTANIWLYSVQLLAVLQPKITIDLKTHSSMTLSVMGTAVEGDNHCQITVENVTRQWL